MTDFLDNADIVTPSDWVPENSMIKVIGVGGGGCNAVTYMYNQKIQGCSFIVCNTDSQALEKSNVPEFLSGLPITLIAASIVALSFLGFAGVA